MVNLDCRGGCHWVTESWKLAASIWLSLFLFLPFGYLYFSLFLPCEKQTCKSLVLHRFKMNIHSNIILCLLNRNGMQHIEDVKKKKTDPWFKMTERNHPLNSRSLSHCQGPCIPVSCEPGNVDLAAGQTGSSQTFSPMKMAWKAKALPLTVQGCIKVNWCPFHCPTMVLLSTKSYVKINNKIKSSRVCYTNQLMS